MYWESGVRCDKIIVTWHRRRFYEQPYSMFDKFHEKSNLSKWSKGPEWATDGPWGNRLAVPNLPTRTTPTLTPAQEASPAGSTKMPRRETELHFETNSAANGKGPSHRAWVLRSMRKVNGKAPPSSFTVTFTDADAKPCGEQQQTQWCDVKNVTRQNHVPGAPWE